MRPCQRSVWLHCCRRGTKRRLSSFDRPRRRAANSLQLDTRACTCAPRDGRGQCRLMHRAQTNSIDSGHLSSLPYVFCLQYRSVGAGSRTPWWRQTLGTLPGFDAPSQPRHFCVLARVERQARRQLQRVPWIACMDKFAITRRATRARKTQRTRSQH